MQLIFHPIFLEHDTGRHPENAERVRWALDEEYVKPESGKKYLTLAHSKGYVSMVKKACENAMPLDADTKTSKKSFEAACYAVGATLKASEIGGFALVRPPGHHAPHGGFCLFNNIAIAAIRFASHGRKALIIDWDAHHGNGTQELVMGNDSIHYFSTHQAPFYPGTGLESVGNSTNVPLAPGTDDRAYARAVDATLPKILEEFDPDVIGVSAGFDSLKGDPIAQLALTEKSYLHVCELIKDRQCFFVLEGGYIPSVVEKNVKNILSFFER